MDQSKLKINSQFAWKGDDNRKNLFLPASIRGLIIGKSACGKSTVLFNLLLQPNWLDYDHLFVFGKSLYQPEYQILKKGFEAGLSKSQISNIFYNQSQFNDPIQLIEDYEGKREGHIKVEFFNDCKSIPDPSSLDKNNKNLLVLDDCLLEKQNKAEAYWTRSRHVNFICWYLSQNYFRLPRTTIRENSNVIILFQQDAKNLQHIHADHCTDIPFQQFKSFCNQVWATKYQFVTIVLDQPTNSGKYRKNFDEIMSFIDLPNSDDVVADYLTTIKRVQQRNQDEKTSHMEKTASFQEMFKPVVQATQNQTKDLTMALEKKEDPISVFNFYTIRDRDKYFGIEKYRGKNWLGNQEVELKDNAIILADNSKYKATPGLLELIYEKTPNWPNIPEEDKANYAEIAEKTHLIDNPQNTDRSSNVKGTNKYQILKHLEENYVGSGVVFLPSDINNLEEKLNLLLGEFNAGNRATRNEIIAIVDYLLQKRIISKTEAKSINNFLK
jgi:hypothetical protein